MIIRTRSSPGPGATRATTSALLLSPMSSRPQLETALLWRAGQGHLSCRHPVDRLVGSHSVTGTDDTASGPGGLAPSGHFPPISWQHTGTQGMPRGSGQYIHVSPGSPWLHKGQPHRPRLGPPPRGSVRNLIIDNLMHRRHQQRQGKAGMWKERLCRYLGKRNAHTRHA